MIKFVIIAALAAVACRMILGRWPWEYLAARRGNDSSLTAARKLLGVSAQADARQIRDAHRRLSAGHHPDQGGTHASQQELNAARDLLLARLPNSTAEPPHAP